MRSPWASLSGGPGPSRGSTRSPRGGTCPATASPHSGPPPSIGPSTPPSRPWEAPWFRRPGAAAAVFQAGEAPAEEDAEGGGGGGNTTKRGGQENRGGEC